MARLCFHPGLSGFRALCSQCSAASLRKEDCACEVGLCQANGDAPGETVNTRHVITEQVVGKCGFHETGEASTYSAALYSPHGGASGRLHCFINTNNTAVKMFNIPWGHIYL